MKDRNKRNAVRALDLNPGEINKQINMAERGLTEEHITRVAAAVPVNSMSKIGLTYFGLSHAAIVNIKSDNQGDAEAQSHAIIRRWVYMNPDNQVQVRYSEICDFYVEFNRFFWKMK